MSWMPCLVPSQDPGGPPFVIGHELVDRYLRFAWARVRPNTLLAIGFDLKVFFTVIDKEPAAVTTQDVFAFVEAQRRTGVWRERGSPRGRRGRSICENDPASVIEHLWVVRVSGRCGRHRPEPGASRSWESHEPATRFAVGTGAADSASDLGS